MLRLAVQRGLSVILGAFAMLLFVVPIRSLAQVAPKNITETQQKKVLQWVDIVSGSAGYQTTGSPTIYQTISNYTQIALGFVGILLLIYLIYAGYLWLTAGGNAEQVTKAKDHIRNAIIGLLIILSAYIITVGVTGYLRSATTGSEVTQ